MFGISFQLLIVSLVYVRSASSQSKFPTEHFDSDEAELIFANVVGVLTNPINKFLV